jgi:hypothetical protein
MSEPQIETACLALAALPRCPVVPLEFFLKVSFLQRRESEKYDLPNDFENISGGENKWVWERVAHGE